MNKNHPVQASCTPGTQEAKERGSRTTGSTPAWCTQQDICLKRKKKDRIMSHSGERRRVGGEVTELKQNQERENPTPLPHVRKGTNLHISKAQQTLSRIDMGSTARHKHNQTPERQRQSLYSSKPCQIQGKEPLALLQQQWRRGRKLREER